MGIEEHKVNALIAKVSNFKVTSLSLWGHLKSLNEPEIFVLQEDTFEEEAEEEKETCEDWQQLQKLGVWDVVCGSGIVFNKHKYRQRQRQ